MNSFCVNLEENNKRLQLFLTFSIIRIRAPYPWIKNVLFMDQECLIRSFYFPIFKECLR
jgi:hypothetical protein